MQRRSGDDPDDLLPPSLGTGVAINGQEDRGLGEGAVGTDRSGEHIQRLIHLDLGRPAGAAVIDRTLSLDRIARGVAAKGRSIRARYQIEWPNIAGRIDGADRGAIPTALQDPEPVGSFVPFPADQEGLPWALIEQRLRHDCTVLQRPWIYLQVTDPEFGRDVGRACR